MRLLAVMMPLVGCSEFEINPTKDGPPPGRGEDTGEPTGPDPSVDDSGGDTDSGVVADTDDCDTGVSATGTWALGVVEPDPHTVATCRDLGGEVDFAFVREWEVPHESFMMQAVVAPDNGASFATIYFDDAAHQQLWTLDGRDGSTIAELPLGNFEDDGSTPFVGDLDGDGANEFARTSWSDVQWVDGASHAVTSLFNPYSGGGTQDEVLSLVDIDLDGDFEVVLPLASFDLDGTLHAQTPDALESTGAFVMDLDLDGLPELVNGAGIWSPIDASGVAWDAAARPDYAFYGAPVDAGGVADVLFTTGRESVNRGNRDGTLDFRTGGAGWRGLAAMADATGDGVPDMCTVEYRAEASTLLLVDVDGVTRREWRFGRYTLLAGACSMADLDADGVYEVVLLGYDGLWILDGVTGAILATDPTIRTDARDSSPVIADLDGDGSAEILVVTRDAILALGPATGRWARTRPVWNQLSYDVTSIRDDGSLVSAPVPVWSTYGIFRAQPSHDGAHPDLVVTVSSERVCETTTILRVELSNPGATAAAAGATLRLLAADGTLVELVAAPLPAIPPGERVSAEISVETSALGALWVVEVAPAHADECDWTNNRAEGTP